ncbi:MAG: type IX secretion system protein PorQ [Bacteroidales bacterium]|nr:type IX secretion system protein PorQ [Bacteroidales bacterium]
MTAIKYKTIILIALCAFVSSIDLYGQHAGNSVYNFLNATNSTRVTALGSNFLPIYDNDISLAYANPSLINKQMHNNISLDYIDFIADINSGLISYAYNFEKVGTFVASMQFANYGKFDQTDNTGQKIGEFNASDYAFIVGWSKPLSEKFVIGANIKNIFSSLEEYKSYGIAADVAITYFDMDKQFSSSLLLKNMGRQITSYASGENEQLPFDIQLGIAKKFEHAPIRLVFLFNNLHKWSLNYENPDSEKDIDPFTGEKKEVNKYAEFGDNALRHLAMGVEFVPGKGNFMVRMGYNYRRQREMKIYSKAGLVGFSFGFGIKVYNFKVSYTRANYHLAGGTNTISVGTNFDTLLKGE